MNSYLVITKYGSKGSTSPNGGMMFLNGRHHFSYNGSNLDVIGMGLSNKKRFECLNV